MGALSTHRMPGWARAALVFAVALTASAAQAQTSDKRIPGTDVPHANGDGMDTHLFRPALDSKGFFSVNGSDILGANNISFGLVLDYGRNIMRLERRPRAGVRPPAPEHSGLSEWRRQPQTAVTMRSRDNRFRAPSASTTASPIGRRRSYDPGDPDDRRSGQRHRPHRRALQTTDDSTPRRSARSRCTPSSGSRASKRASASRCSGRSAFRSPTRRAISGPTRASGTGRRSRSRSTSARSRAFRIGANVGYRGHTGDNPQFGLDTGGRTQLAGRRVRVRQPVHLRRRAFLARHRFARPRGRDLRHLPARADRPTASRSSRRSFSAASSCSSSATAS